MYQHQNIEELAPQILELLQLGESEEVEFKSAKVGLPKDFWPTYSAFANTHGMLSSSIYPKPLTNSAQSILKVFRMTGLIVAMIRGTINVNVMKCDA